MVHPSKYNEIEFEWDHGNIMEIGKHHVFTYEAEECFFNRHQVFRNKSKPGRDYETYKLIGISDGGKKLLLIFYLKEKVKDNESGKTTALIRVITGWRI